MELGPATRRLFHVALFCLLVLPAAPRWAWAQANTDPIQLQNSGIAQLDHWLNHTRTTGDAATTRNELAAAQVQLQASYLLFAQRQEPARAAWSAIKLGDIQRYLNQWAKAVSTYQVALQLAELAQRPDYQTKALAELAFSEMNAGSMDAAADHVAEAVRLGTNCGDAAFYFDALLTAAELETKRGNLTAAGDYINRALAIKDRIVDQQQLYLVYANGGDIYFQDARACNAREDPDVCYQLLQLARDDYRKAEAIAQHAGYRYLAGVTQGFLKDADTLETTIQGARKQNQTLAAMSMFSPKQPKDVLVTEDFAPGALNAQAVAMMENTIKQMQDWLARMQQQGLTVRNVNPDDLWVEGSLAQMKGDQNAALPKFQGAVQLLEQDRRNLRDPQARSAFMEDKIGYYYSPALILLNQKRYAEAFALFEQSRSRAMADMLVSRPLNLGAAKDRLLFSDLQSQRTAIAALQGKLFNLTGGADRDQNGKQIADLEAQIAGLQEKYRLLEARIAREAPKLNQLTSSKPVTLESVQRAAAEGRYDILYYVLTDTNLFLWHIGGADVEVKKVFLPHAVLSVKAATLHDRLVAPRDSPDAAFNDDISRQLYLYLIQPVSAFIKSHHLVLIPQDELTTIPFQALENPADGKYVGETFEVSYAPSATVLATLEAKPNLKNGRLLAVADPQIHDASEEVKAIGALYPGRSKVQAGEQASKTEVKTWVGGYDFVHLSVHGKFNPSDPLLSYLQFKPGPTDDGHLTAAEMFGLPLQKNALVVLSACETGKAQATHSGELIGMVRSLLYAGAGNLVLSSWEVNSASTKLWMETFYREGQTKAPAEAARLALVAVKANPAFHHPFFWAPFLLTGK
jgi:CHAT domain-containing protein